MLSTTGAWIFVSHSMRDIHAVRRVRDALEQRGHYPLLFFLKSIKQDDEIDSLIKREILARSFFLLCESPNSRQSIWVQREVEFIRLQKAKMFAIVDLEAPWREQEAAIERLSSRISVYISHSSGDSELAERFSRALNQADYAILSRQGSIEPGERDGSNAIAAIDEAISRGVVIAVLTPDGLCREEGFHWLELNHAIERIRDLPDNHQKLVLVLPDDSKSVVELLPEHLRSFQMIDLSGVPVEEQSTALVQALPAYLPLIDA